MCEGRCAAGNGDCNEGCNLCSNECGVQGKIHSSTCVHPPSESEEARGRNLSDRDVYNAVMDALCRIKG